LTYPTRHVLWRALLRLTIAAAIAIPVAASPAASGSAEAACSSGFQSRVNSAAAGSTITIPACTYYESVTVQKPLTINASGVTIDGQNTRSVGLRVLASDVTVNGLTVTNIRSETHGGAVWTTAVNRFTFRNGVARDSATICVSLNGGSGHRIIDSELTGCGKEGFFTNAVFDSSFVGNHIHHNNTAFGFDPFIEAGGGKSMDGARITFDRNDVHDNGGPGIWFDNGMHDVVVSNNRVYRNDQQGIFFEISAGAQIYGNAVWDNGWGFARWGYGAGIVISSSDRAVVRDNVVAWNGRGISVISQARGPAPHNDNVVHHNVIIQRAGSFVAGFYDDHGGSLFSSANGNYGYDNSYWVSDGEPSGERFQYAGGRSTLGAYNSTAGEERGRYLSASERDQILGANGMPSESGGTLPRPVPKPRANISGGILSTGGSVTGSVTWPAIAGASAYQLQVQRNGGAWQSVRLSYARARAASIGIAASTDYRARVRARTAGGTWTSWGYTSTFRLRRYEENHSAITDSGWARARSTGASGGYVDWKGGAGQYVRFTFTGRSIAWVAPKSSNRGRAAVYIDGVYRGTINLYSSTTLTRRIVFRTGWATAAQHTLMIRVSGSARVDVDALLVLS
jgi:parallel beta-helix repeat protein